MQRCDWVQNLTGSEMPGSPQAGALINFQTTPNAAANDYPCTIKRKMGGGGRQLGELGGGWGVVWGKAPALSITWCQNILTGEKGTGVKG